MPKRPKGQKLLVSSASQAGKALERWENEGGAPSMGDQSQKKGERETSFVGEVLEHPGSSGEMHFAYDNCNKDARRTSRQANSHDFNWSEWFVPTIVIPAVIIVVLLARTFYLYM